MTHSRTSSRRIEVSWQDIRCGTPNEIDKCPLVNGLRRVFPGVPILITLEFPSLRPIATINYRQYSLPPHCGTFIANFDSGKPVEPMSFTLGEH